MIFGNDSDPNFRSTHPGLNHSKIKQYFKKVIIAKIFGTGFSWRSDKDPIFFPKGQIRIRFFLWGSVSDPNFSMRVRSGPDFFSESQTRIRFFLWVSDQDPTFLWGSDQDPIFSLRFRSGSDVFWEGQIRIRFVL